MRHLSVKGYLENTIILHVVIFHMHRENLSTIWKNRKFIVILEN